MLEVRLTGSYIKMSTCLVTKASDTAQSVSSSNTETRKDVCGGLVPALNYDIFFQKMIITLLTNQKYNF